MYLCSVDLRAGFAYNARMTNGPSAGEPPHLQRRLGLLQATALNMSNMVGVGPFITIPALMGAVNGQLDRRLQIITVGLGVAAIALLYRKINSIGKITIALWIGVLLTTGAVILGGVGHFNPRIAFDYPPHAFDFSMGFVFGLGA